MNCEIVIFYCFNVNVCLQAAAKRASNRYGTRYSVFQTLPREYQRHLSLLSNMSKLILETVSTDHFFHFILLRFTYSNCKKLNIVRLASVQKCFNLFPDLRHRSPSSDLQLGPDVREGHQPLQVPILRRPCSSHQWLRRNHRQVL